ncbi:MAG: DNA-deoxyinosine glycosylase [Lachnospiraceae bacterium]|nr:DNA-deoxyinosine glycosylase [Lachnospiraceae bacterium]
MVRHPIAPVYDKHSNILILGSFPSVKSREQGFFYGHPQNRFWRVLAAVYGDEVPQTVEEKKEFLLQKGVAVWDVIASCEILGSSDSSIKNAVPTDLSDILAHTPVRRIYVNGKKAEQLYRKYQEKQTGIKAVCLPSTSPANAAWGIERLTEAWQVIRDEAVG